ncbi:MAG: hypothetical protein IPK03_01145 [Bacteroidetes bacterium]|nr:hypothetical protein [Bacteroidota bacterium]
MRIRQLPAGYYGAIDNWYFDLKLIKISTNNFSIWEKQFFRRLTYKDGTVGLVKKQLNQYLLASNLSLLVDKHRRFMSSPIMAIALPCAILKALMERASTMQICGKSYRMEADFMAQVWSI